MPDESTRRFLEPLANYAVFVLHELRVSKWPILKLNYNYILHDWIKTDKASMFDILCVTSIVWIRLIKIR